MNAHVHPDHTTSSEASDTLRRLAEAAGLAIEWTDAFGKPQRVSADTLRKVLAALQVDCGDDAACEASIAMLAEEESTLALPPLITARTGHEIVLSPHAEVYGEPYRIELEGGDELSGRITDNNGRPPRLPAIDRIGYHRLYIGERHVLVLAVAPLRCFTVEDAVHGSDTTPHLWALAAQLYSLRRADGETIGDAGIGDFTALEILARSAAAHGAAAIAISPVHAMFSANPYQYSPYGPSSRLFFNVMHIDPASISGEEALAASIARLDAEAERKRLHDAELVDWPAAARWRLAVLRDLFDHYDIHCEGWKEFESFRIEGGMMLEDHARFEALHAAMREQGIHGSWRDWPEEYRDPRSDQIAAFAEAHDNDIMFHAFLQWQAARGLRHAQRSAIAAGMRVGLITDLAVGAESSGSQAWSRQHQMLNGLSVGAPPDILGPRGQNWGLAAFSPRALRQYGFQAYIEMLRAAFRYAGGVRIDHILGLTRLWLVPNGSDGREGVYLRYPFEDLMHLIALESHRSKAIVIGEDLGTVPAGFSEQLGEAGLMGIRVLWFEQEGERFREAGSWSPQAIATTDTHDLPTVVGWWRGRDIDWRAQLDLLAPGTDIEQEYAARKRDREALARSLHEMQPHAHIDPEDEQPPLEAILRFVGATSAPLAIVPLEDVLALEEQPNLPNTIDQHPNWRRRLPASVDRMLDNESVAARLAVLDDARKRKASP
ncbi:MAG TPA: 4-alpha-glucanotransferase [Oxalicibacterium sp.]|nr:4-alpha-glucanotransferase [Oxalicibacterium sp.]